LASDLNYCHSEAPKRISHVKEKEKEKEKKKKKKKGRRKKERRGIYTHEDGEY